jgi:hypothetical protein
MNTTPRPIGLGIGQYLLSEKRLEMIISISFSDENVIDIAKLTVFAAVARLSGMNRATAELNTVQSNITARIKG